MNVAFTLGRIALVVLFVFSGVGKLLDIPGTAEMLQSKVAIPAALADLTSQIAATVGMPIYQILAIVLGVIEAGCALLIALNILTRTAAVVLLIYTAVTTYYFNDFWNMTGADRCTAGAAGCRPADNRAGRGPAEYAEGILGGRLLDRHRRGQRQQRRCSNRANHVRFLRLV